MTTFAAPQVGTATSPVRRPVGRLTSVGSTMAGWVHTYRAAARAQRPSGLDAPTLVVFGRD